MIEKKIKDRTQQTIDGRRWVVLFLILAAVFLRTRGLFANTFHADEALFASWARLIAVWRDPLLSTVAVDKPPLLFYLQAIFYPLQGPVTWAARLPSWIASILSVSLMWAVSNRRGFKKGLTAEFGVVLLVFSPLAIQFSATAYTDPLLVFWLLVALYLALRPGPGYGAAAAWGLAFLTKYQAILFLPLIFGGWWVLRPRKKGRQAFLWMGLAAVSGAILIAWDIARGGQLTLWTNQMKGFGGLRLIWSWELLPRLAGWFRLSGWLMGWGWIALLIWMGGTLAGKRKSEGRFFADAVNRLMALTAAGYFSLHWLVAIPIWDRYWLPLVPLVILLAAGWGGIPLPARLADKFSRLLEGNTWVSAAALLLLAAALWPQGLMARQGVYPVGGYPAADGGAQQIAAVLQPYPYGTVLYDHFYSWQWRYYLFDTGVYVSWFPSPAWFGHELQVFSGGQGDRFVVLPGDERGGPIRREAADLGFTLTPVAEFGEMVLYQIEEY